MKKGSHRLAASQTRLHVANQKRGKEREKPIGNNLHLERGYLKNPFPMGGKRASVALKETGSTGEKKKRGGL